jgi:hypothetical protein
VAVTTNQKRDRVMNPTNEVTVHQHQSTAKGNSSIAVVVSETDNAVMVIDEINNKLASITSVVDAKEVADQAAALGHYAKRAKNGLTFQNRCSYIKLMAARRAGELLKDVPRAPRGGAQSGRGEKHSQPFGECLAELHITWDTATQWQRLAKVPVEHLEQWWDECERHREELTDAFVTRRLRSLLSDEDFHPDAPWMWDKDLEVTLVTNSTNRLLTEVRVFAEKLQVGRLYSDMGTVLADRVVLHSSELEKVCSWFLVLREQTDRCIEALRRRMDDAPVTWGAEGRSLLDLLDDNPSS